MAWHKSTYSNSHGNCVEVSYMPNGNVLVRDSKDTDGPCLVFTPGEWAAFTDGVKDNEFDYETV